MKFNPAGLLHQHHAPRPIEGPVGPTAGLRLKIGSERQGDLDGKIEAYDMPGPSRGARSPGFSRPVARQLGALETISTLPHGDTRPAKAGTPCQKASRPIGGEKQRCANDHQPWKNPDAKQEPCRHVKRDDERKCPWPCSAMEEQWNNREIEQCPEPAGGIRHRDFIQQWADQWKLAPCGQPGAQWLGGKKPVRGELGQPRKNVNDPELKAEQPQHPAGHNRVRRPTAPRRVQRPDAMARQKYHQPAQEADQVIVIEIGRLIDELDVGKPDEEEGNRRPIAPTQRHSKGQPGQQHEQPMHRQRRQGPYPGKEFVRKEKCGLQIKFLDPSPGQKPNHRKRHEEAKEDPKGGRRCPVDRRIQAGPIATVWTCRASVQSPSVELKVSVTPSAPAISTFKSTSSFLQAS